MAQPYVGEIRIFGGNFAPAGWMFCSGQLLPISENETLFQLIGTTYGGDGQSTFALPDLQGRIPLHWGTGSSGTSYLLGERSGVETVTLTTQQLPTHTHPAAVTDTGQTNAATGAKLANATSTQTGVRLFSNVGPTDVMNAQTILPVGGNQAHENCQPFLCLQYIISLFGIFPSQN